MGRDLVVGERLGAVLLELARLELLARLQHDHDLDELAQALEAEGVEAVQARNVLPRLVHKADLAAVRLRTPPPSRAAASL